MCKVLILLFIIITFIKNPENAPNLLALDHHLPLNWKFVLWLHFYLVSSIIGPTGMRVKMRQTTPHTSPFVYSDALPWRCYLMPNSRIDAKTSAHNNLKKRLKRRKK